MTPPSPPPLVAAFSRLREALGNANVDAYRALLVGDAAPQDALFLRNARNLKDGGLTLVLRGATEEGGVATVGFDVVDAAGTVKDRGQVVYTLETDGWRLRQL